MNREKTDIPDAMGWLHDASPDLRYAIRDRADHLTVPKGDCFIRADQPTGGLTAILQGRLDLHSPNVRGQRTLVHAFGPGWWLGGRPAISGEQRRFDHVAASALELLRLSRNRLLQISEDHPEFWRCLARMVTINMGLAIDAAEQHRLADPTSRVVMCFLRLHQTGAAWCGRLPISQADLAAIANLSRRRTISALETLEQSGALRRTYGAVEILNPDILKSWQGDATS
jgi:CRP-like cAMP-binding protein